jgi:aspartyl protease family protein
MLAKAVAFLVIALIIGGVAARAADTRSKSAAASAALAAAPAPVSAPAAVGNSRSIALSRGNGGHFWFDARVDGRTLEMVVDTGATQIALRASDAARLGIHPAARDYVVKVATPNGITRAALVQLRAIEHRRARRSRAGASGRIAGRESPRYVLPVAAALDARARQARPGTITFALAFPYAPGELFTIARMSEAISGAFPPPAYRCAHAGYLRSNVSRSKSRALSKHLRL